MLCVTSGNAFEAAYYREEDATLPALEYASVADGMGFLVCEALEYDVAPAAAASAEAAGDEAAAVAALRVSFVRTDGRVVHAASRLKALAADGRVLREL